MVRRSIGTGLIYFAIKKFIPDTDLALHYFAYALLTIWTQVGAPLLFKRIKLLMRRDAKLLREQGFGAFHTRKPLCHTAGGKSQ